MSIPKGWIFLYFYIFMYVIQHCFICRPLDSTVSEDAGIDPRTVATLALTARRSYHLARSHPQLGYRSHPIAMAKLLLLKVGVSKLFPKKHT